MSPKDTPPRHEPEVMYANGRVHAAWCNKSTREPYDNIYIALELAEQAYEAHRLPYKPGLSNISEYLPHRFTWFCDETAGVKQCVMVRDDKTKRVATWPHWL